MIKLIVFNDGNVTFEYNEKGLKELSEQQKLIESIFGTMSDEAAIEIVKSKYPELSEQQILDSLKLIFVKAYKEIIPGFLRKMRLYNPNISIAVATEHTKYISNYLKDFVDYYYISNEMGFDKSDTRFFEKIIHQSGLNPRDILYIDYDLNNINTAKAVGMTTKQVDENDFDLENKVIYTQLGHRMIDAINNFKSVKEKEERSR